MPDKLRKPSRISSYKEREEKKKKEEKQRKKLFKRKRPGSSMRRSLGQRKLSTQAKRQVTRSRMGESPAPSHSIAANDIVHTILRHLVPQRLTGRDYVDGVVVLLRWVLYGADEALRRQAASAPDLTNLRMRFATSFDMTIATPGTFSGELWQWSKTGPGDWVADVVARVMMRVPISDLKYPEKCGVIVRQAVETLARDAEMSPRLFQGMFNSALAEFVQGRVTLGRRPDDG